MFYQSSNIFDTLFEAIPEGAIIIDKKHTIVAANFSAEKMFGYKKGELNFKDLTVLIPKKYQEKYEKHFTFFLNNQKLRRKRNGLTLFGITKTKKIFPTQISLNPFSINKKTYAIALIADISARKETEKKIEQLHSQLEKKIQLRTFELKNTIKQLKELNFNYKKEIVKRVEAENKIKVALKKEIELNELKTKFLSLVSHEFKTPLSGILTSTFLLKKYQSGDQQDKRDKHIKTINDKVVYLNNILNDFLSIERLDSNKLNYKYTTFNLSKIINEVVYNSNMLLKSGQRITIPKDTDSYILHQDEKILELALSNLIHNAIKYSPENTDINLELYTKNKNIVFKVIDKGIGIPEKDQKFVFNRYFRAENVLNTQGTGIGLNIVKSHLENIGGSISFTSKENKGSVFTIELPLKSEQ
ncbi:PAS domain-containing sensor histidine kinase [Lutibacter sp. B1]|uniref:PAS domain-containing sensor histidine kinase n=1 Tax=Lutibacter sp. B1 TaxID=2725996 RepID=UPI00145771F3|nr:PAS domain-containing sensor histidine kinase [Lutibacter sp. B1]NLP58678.1 PAS domain S-box protein [Lutibacter sp. B1]